MVHTDLNINPKFSLFCKILEKGYGMSLVSKNNNQFYYEAIVKGFLEPTKLVIGITINKENQPELFSVLFIKNDDSEEKSIRYPGINITGINYDDVLHIKQGISCTLEKIRKNCSIFFFPKIIEFSSNFQDYVCITESIQARFDAVKVIYEYAEFYQGYNLAKNGEYEVFLIGSSIMLLYLNYTKQKKYSEFEQNLIKYIDIMVKGTSRKYDKLEDEGRMNILRKKISNFQYDIKCFLQDPSYKLENFFYSLFTKPLDWNNNNTNYTYIEEELLELKDVFVESYKYLNRVMDKEFDLELDRLYLKDWSIYNK